MAKDEANQNVSGEAAREASREAPRVHKAHDVHKRRSVSFTAEASAPESALASAFKPDSERKSESERKHGLGFVFKLGRGAASAAPPAPDSGSERKRAFAPRPRRASEPQSEPQSASPIGAESDSATELESGSPSDVPSDPVVASDSPAGTREAAQVVGELSEEQGEQGGREGGKRDAAEPKQKRWKLVAGTIAGVVVAALLVFAGYVAGSRWVRYDDEADIQGAWYVQGTSVPLEIADGKIAINEETAYDYRIDPASKTIEYTFGSMAGQGRYWFGDDRKTLVITDGDGYTMWSTLLDDLSYDATRLFGRVDLPATEASIVLSRTPSQPIGREAALPTGGTQEDGSSSASAGDEPSDMLKVSDIMLEEESDSEVYEG